MRHWLAAVLASGLVLGFSGCGTSDSTRPDAQRSAPNPFAKSSLGRSTSPRQLPDAIAFWGGNRGLLGTATTHLCAGAVSLTTDGGRSFHVVLRTRGPVEWISATGQSEAWAVVQACKFAREESVHYRLIRTVDGGRSWQELPPSEAFNPSFATPTRGFAVRVPLAPTDFIGPPVGEGLLSTTDRGRTWRHLAGPAGCRRNEGETISSSALTQVWVLCVTEPGAGRQGKAIFATRSAGRTWRPLVDVGFESRSPRGGVSPLGYPLGMSFSKTGFGLLWEDRGPLYLTHDGGREWQPTGVLIPDVDYGVSGAALSHTDAYLLRSGRHSRQGPPTTDLLRTMNAGDTWTVVHRWPVVR
jgi:hypothetical protein